MRACVCACACYAPSSLLWPTETVSGAGSSTRGGSQCGLSLMWTQRADEVRGRNYKSLRQATRVDDSQPDLILLH